MLDEHELSHRRIKPHCPEENGLMERANRTLGEALEGEELTDYLQAVKVIARMIRWYNEERLHSALGFLRPVDYYRGKPEEIYAERRQKLAAARHRRREKKPSSSAAHAAINQRGDRCLTRPGSVPYPLKQNTCQNHYHRVLGDLAVHVYRVLPGRGYCGSACVASGGDEKSTKKTLGVPGSPPDRLLRRRA